MKQKFLNFAFFATGIYNAYYFSDIITSYTKDLFDTSRNNYEMPLKKIETKIFQDIIDEKKLIGY